MSRRLRILARAGADIDGIFDWLARRSPQGAANWYAVLVATVDKIVETPEQFSVAAESLPRWNRNILQALFKTARGRRYRIVFELTNTDVCILRVRGPGQPPLRRRDLPKE